jgi:hypothetical protein
MKRSRYHAIVRLNDVRTVGSNAGRTVTVEQVEEGVWVIKASRVIPENEVWLHSSSASKKLSRAIDWAEKNPTPFSLPKPLSFRRGRR